MSNKVNLKPKNVNLDGFDDFDYDSLLNLNPAIKRKQLAEKRVDVFYLYGEVGDVSDYVDMIHCLSSADESDEIHIRIASDGGQLDTMIAILHAMRRCKGEIITFADSQVCSAATYIFLAAKNVIISDFANFMFHTASGGYYGKTQENISRVMHIDGLMDKLNDEYLSPFFTKEELIEMKNGKDFYISSDEMVERINTTPGLSETKKPTTTRKRKVGNV